jgi:Bacterial regulatory protein, Fis family
MLQVSIEAPVPGERDLIEAALAQTRGKVSGLSGAAAKLGIPASTLESKIRSLKTTNTGLRSVSVLSPKCLVFRGQDDLLGKLAF